VKLNGFSSIHFFHRALAFIVILAAMLCAFPASAKFSTARLSGTVVDSSGLSIVGAAVTAVQQGTAYTQTVKTGSSANTGSQGFPVSGYGGNDGLQHLFATGVTLSIGQAVTLPVQLKLGSVSQKVTVVGNAALVTTNSSNPWPAHQSKGNRQPSAE
jgi:hypothetical protein